MTQYLTISSARLEEICAHTVNDKSLQALIQVIRTNRPELRHATPTLTAAYFDVRDELSEQERNVFHGSRAIIPAVLRHDLYKRVHRGHIGADGCMRRTRECLHWPRMSKAVKDYIGRSDVCRAHDAKQPKETLQSHDILPRP